MAFVRYPNVAQGYNMRTILEVVLKITQREICYVDDHLYAISSKSEM